MNLRKQLYKKQKKLLFAFASSAVLGLSGCEQELASDKSYIQMIDTTSEALEGNFQVVKIEEVKDEDFQLEITYLCDDESWRVTDTKHLYLSIKTIGLSSDKEVYIDNIHSDTFIVATEAVYSGILQDSMDDHTHNSLMIGFPISNTNGYYGCNVIEGQNSEFLEGWSYGNQYSTSGHIETKRYLESDFLSKGGYANQIENVIDLIIIDKNTLESHCVSVFSNILVRVNNKVTFLEKDEEVTYEYQMDGTRTRISGGSSRKRVCS